MSVAFARPHGEELRHGRVSMPGQEYHVITVTLDRMPVFSDFRNARALIKFLFEAQIRDEATTLAFVVTPDHLHWLMQLGAGVSLSRVVGAVKAVSSHQLGKRLWQKGFHDHALRNVKTWWKLSATSSQIHCLPVWWNVWGIARIGMRCGCRSPALGAIQCVSRLMFDCGVGAGARVANRDEGVAPTRGSRFCR